jgi:hypothetical protein
MRVMIYESCACMLRSKKWSWLLLRKAAARSAETIGEILRAFARTECANSGHAQS